MKKRKNADRIRLEKQEAARKRIEDQLRKNKAKKNKFVRAETILAKKYSSKKELKRISRVAKIEKNADQKIKLVSAAVDNVADQEVHNEAWDEKPKLLLVARVRSPNNAKIPSKAKKVLQALRLEHSNFGTFVKLTPTVLPLLKLVAPYIVIGTPNLVTVRELIQKRASVTVEDEANNNAKKQVLLDDNTIIEEKLGDYGIICTEDLVHEIYTLGDNFKQVMNFLRPFQLAPPVTGWGPMSKLKRIEIQERKDSNPVNNRGSAPLVEIDIDQYVANQN